MQQAIFWTTEEVVARANKLYAEKIRSQVECEGNIGKMVVIDAETGEYAVDRSGIHSAIALKGKNPHRSSSLHSWLCPHLCSLRDCFYCW